RDETRGRVHRRDEVAHVVARTVGGADDDVDAVVQLIEVEVGDDHGDFDEFVDVQVQTGHLAVDPDDSLCNHGAILCRRPDGAGAARRIRPRHDLTGPGELPDRPVRAPSPCGSLDSVCFREDSVRASAADEGTSVRYVLPAVIVVIGLLVGMFGVLQKTLWAPDDTRTASVQLDEPGPVVVVEPGVLNLYDTPATLTATATEPDQEITISRTTKENADAWVGASDATRIVGLAEEEALESRTVT